MAMMEAWQKFERGEGTMIYMKKYVNSSIDFVI